MPGSLRSWLLASNPVPLVLPAPPVAALPHRRVIVLIARLRHDYPATHPENRFTSNNRLITGITSPQTQQPQGFAAAKISDSGACIGARPPVQ
jgi:hypothetical protein